jgi:hypothetical protein
VCIHGYRVDGVVDASDFEVEDPILLGQVYTDQFDGYSLDVSDLLGLGGEFFGIQFSVDSFGDLGGSGLTDVRLTASDAQPVPEPATLGLIGLGLGALALRYRRRTIG